MWNKANGNEMQTPQNQWLWQLTWQWPCTYSSGVCSPKDDNLRTDCAHCAQRPKENGTPKVILAISCLWATCTPFLQHPSPQCEVYSDRNELSDLLIIFSYKVFPALTMHRTVESLTGLTGLTWSLFSKSSTPEESDLQEKKANRCEEKKNDCSKNNQSH